MTTPAPAPDPSTDAALHTIAIDLCQGDASALERAAVRLKDLVSQDRGTWTTLFSSPDAGLLVLVQVLC
jgi:hypothetical protein